MIVLDATLLIAYLEHADPHHDTAVKILTEHADVPLATSSLTLAETLVGAVVKGTVDRAIEVMAAELDIMTVAILGTEALRLAEIRASSRLKIPDCCVLLAAEKLSAPTLATFDRRLAEVAAGRGLQVLPATR